MSSPAPTPQGGPPPAAAGPAPSAAPANPQQVMLAQISMALRRLADASPVLAPGLQKAQMGIQEAISAMLVQSPQPGPEQTPPQ